MKPSASRERGRRCLFGSARRTLATPASWLGNGERLLLTCATSVVVVVVVVVFVVVVFGVVVVVVVVDAGRRVKESSSSYRFSGAAH